MTTGATKQKVRQFILFVDTNAIWTNDENIGRIDLLPSEFRKRWEQVCVPGDVTLVIPEVVILEIASQKTRQILRAYQNAREHLRQIELVLHLGIPSISELDWGRISHAVRLRLREQVKAVPKCQSVKIPYDSIAANIRGIVDGSLWRFPPFKEGNTESGFRDALVLETLKYFQSGLIHSDIAFICKDERLKIAAKKTFDKAKNFGIYSKLEEYETFLGQARERFAPEFLHAVIDKAGPTFKEIVWDKLALAKQLRDKYELYPGKLAFEKPRETIKGGLLGLGNALMFAGEPSFEIGETHLISVVGDDEFHFGTNVFIATPYTRPEALFSPLRDEKREFRTIILSVEWSVVTNSEKELSDSKLLRHDQIHESFAANLEKVQQLREFMALF